MRTIKELLELMLKYKTLFSDGLCLWTYRLCEHNIISPKEYESLRKYIKYNPPDYFSWTNFVKSHNKRGTYYFPSSEIKPRIYWIKKHIKRLS